jgi:hypothetical protein
MKRRPKFEMSLWRLQNEQMSMEDDFSKALDALHNRIDGAIETTQPVSLASSWTEKKEPKELTPVASKSATNFLVQLFFLIFAVCAL